MRHTEGEWRQMLNCTSFILTEMKAPERFLLLHVACSVAAIACHAYSTMPFSPALKKHVSVAHNYLQQVDQCDADMPILTEYAF